MDEYTVCSVDELTMQLDSLPSSTLFRGQTKHYTSSDGAVSMPTSFSRLGCIPPLQFKWSHYAKFILCALSNTNETDFDLFFLQAILQHYGWRSFFIDASSSSAVSAWFSSHTFTCQDTINMGEDCFEQFVMSYHQNASYVPVNSTVFLYAISQDNLSKQGILSHDLADIQAKDFRPRYQAQKAWLIGPLQDNLPPDCVQACIKGPATVFAEFAAAAGYSQTSDLFPSRAEDSLLKLLLSVPWESVDCNTESPIFSRGLRIPEYDYKVIKFHQANVAFFRPFWVADARGPADSPLAKAIFFRTPEEMFYGRSIDIPLSLPNIRSILDKHGTLVIESERILRHPEFHTQSEYFKGVCIRLVDDETAEISELSVDHPGSQVAGMGLSFGWYYKIDLTQRWSRCRHANECPCNNNLLHQHHMWIVAYFEELLSESKYTEQSELDRIHPDVITQ